MAIISKIFKRNKVSSYQKKRTKKDTIFVIVIGLVLVNLTRHFTSSIMILASNYRLVQSWAMCAANLIAIIGVLWLLRSYNVRRKQTVKEDKERMDAS